MRQSKIRIAGKIKNVGLYVNWILRILLLFNLIWQYWEWFGIWIIMLCNWSYTCKSSDTKFAKYQILNDAWGVY